jgi:hypothetical protein
MHGLNLMKKTASSNHDVRGDKWDLLLIRITHLVHATVHEDTTSAGTLATEQRIIFHSTPVLIMLSGISSCGKLLEIILSKW